MGDYSICLGSVPIAVINITTIRNLGRKVFIFGYVVLSLREGRTGTQG